MLTDTGFRMARRRKGDRSVSAPGPRSHRERHIPLHVDPVLDHSRKIEPVRRKPDYRPVEDLRRHEDIVQTFRTRGGSVARTETRPQSKMSQSGVSVPLYSYFQDPRRVLVCIRRHDRRRVLFAMRKIGSGRKVARVHRFTEKSRIRCK